MISLDATPSDYAVYATHYGSAPPGALAAAAKTRLMRWLFGRACSLVAMSHWVGRGLQRDYGVPARKINVLPQGIDLAAWAARAVAGRPGRCGCCSSAATSNARVAPTCCRPGARGSGATSASSSDRQSKDNA